MDSIPGAAQAAAIRSSGLADLPSPVDLHFFTPAQIEERRDDGGCVAFDIVREGKVLFVRPDVAGEPVFPASVREPRASWDSARESVRSAERDLLAVRSIAAAEDVPWEMAAFHAQQAAEKYLKALLLHQRIRPERTHDLTRLLSACRAGGAALPDLDEPCRLLTPYATAGRYGRPLEDSAVGLAAAAAAVAIAPSVRQAMSEAGER